MAEFAIGPAVIAIILCVVLALVGNLWVGDALTTWYPQLIKPRCLPPLWGFILVGLTVYIVEGVVCYRLLVHVAATEAKVVTLTALIVVMVGNEAWNYAFFGLRSTLAAYVAIVAFVAPLIILLVALFAFEPLSGYLMLPYAVWVAYDIWWVQRLWRLNPLPATTLPAREAHSRASVS